MFLVVFNFAINFCFKLDLFNLFGQFDFSNDNYQMFYIPPAMMAHIDFLQCDLFSVLLYLLLQGAPT